MDPLEFAKFAHEWQQRENMQREMEKLVSAMAAANPKVS